MNWHNEVVHAIIATLSSDNDTMNYTLINAATKWKHPQETTISP